MKQIGRFRVQDSLLTCDEKDNMYRLENIFLLGIANKVTLTWSIPIQIPSFPMIFSLEKERQADEISASATCHPQPCNEFITCFSRFSNLRIFFPRNFMFHFLEGYKVSFYVMINSYIGIFDLNRKILSTLKKNKTKNFSNYFLSFISPKKLF